MAPGGCYASHNIGMHGMQAYVEYLRSRPDFVTTIEHERTSGIALTCRPAE
jgi:hypothetical protein